MLRFLPIFLEIFYEAANHSNGASKWKCALSINYNISKMYMTIMIFIGK